MNLKKHINSKLKDYGELTRQQPFNLRKWPSCTKDPYFLLSVPSF